MISTRNGQEKERPHQKMGPFFYNNILRAKTRAREKPTR